MIPHQDSVGGFSSEQGNGNGITASETGHILRFDMDWRVLKSNETINSVRYGKNTRGLVIRFSPGMESLINGTITITGTVVKLLWVYRR